MNIIPDEEDFLEVSLLDSSLSPAERYREAQNLKIHRLADLARLLDVSGELDKPQ